MSISQEKQYMVHEILNKHGFYRLHMQRLKEILHLLEAEEVREARYIQENTIKGLLKMAQKHKSKIKRHFQAKKFAQISQDTKRYVNNIVDDVIEEVKKKELQAQEIQQPPNFNFSLMNYQSYSPIGYGAGEDISKMRIEEEQLKLRQMQMYYYGMFNPSVTNPSQMMGSSMGLPLGNVPHQENRLEFPIKYDPNSFAPNIENKDQISPQQEQKPMKVEGELGAQFFSLKLQQPISNIRQQSDSQVIQQQKPEKLEPKAPKLQSIPSMKKIISTRQIQVQTDIILLNKQFDVIKKPKVNIEVHPNAAGVDTVNVPKRKIIKKEKKDKKDMVPNNQITEKMPQDVKEKLDKPEKQKKKGTAQKTDKIEKNDKNDNMEKIKKPEALSMLEKQEYHQKSAQRQKQLMQEKPQKNKKVEQDDQLYIPDSEDLKRVEKFQNMQLLKMNALKLANEQQAIKAKQKLIVKEDLKNKQKKKGSKKQKIIPALPIPVLQQAPVKQITQAQKPLLQQNRSQVPVISITINRNEEKKIQNDLIITIPDDKPEKIENNMVSIIKVSPPAINNSNIKIVHKQNTYPHEEEKNIFVVMNQEDLMMDHEEQEFMNYKNGRRIGQNQGYSINNYLEGAIANKEQIDIKIKRAKNLTHCACKGTYQGNDLFECLVCGKQYHNKCLQEPLTTKYIECPCCKLQSLDPLSEVKEVIGEFYIKDINRKEFSISMDVNHYEYYCSQKIRKNEIEMRCYRISSNFDSSQNTFPDQCIVRVNESKILEIPALSVTSSLKKRKDYPIVLTSFLFGRIENEDSTEMQQPVHFSLEIKKLAPEDLQNKRVNNQYTFLLGIYYIEKLKCEDLYDKIISTIEPFSDDYINCLMETSENEVEIDRVVCTLEDPYSRKIMDLPVRGLKCAHGQCFDLKTFITFMSTFKNRCWRCPVCSKDSRSFKIDKQQLQLIRRSIQTEQIPSKITFQKDGRIFLKMNKEIEDNEKEEMENKRKIRRMRKKRIEKQQQMEQIQDMESEKLQKIPLDNKSLIKTDKNYDDSMPFFKESRL